MLISLEPRSNPINADTGVVLGAVTWPVNFVSNPADTDGKLLATIQCRIPNNNRVVQLPELQAFLERITTLCDVSPRWMRPRFMHAHYSEHFLILVLGVTKKPQHASTNRLPPTAHVSQLSSDIIRMMAPHVVELAMLDPNPHDRAQAL